MTPGYKTTEFWLKIAALLVSTLIASNAIPVGGIWEKLISISALLLGSLGYTVSRTMIKTAAMLFFVMAIAHTSTGCAWFKSESKAVATDVVDCTKASAVGAIKEFGPAIDALLLYATGANGVVSSEALEDAGKGFAKEIGGCVIADSIARALKPSLPDPNAPKSSPLVADPDSLRRVLATLHPGVKFHTANGDL